MPRKHFLTPMQPRQERLPSWFRVRPHTGANYLKIRSLKKGLKLHTVCEEARCPNIWECWNDGTATFMILGEICTRSCGFCNVRLGRPEALDPEEPVHVAEAVKRLGLRHAVITSVNRDELEDGGAEAFAETIRQIRKQSPACTLELLIPDFQGKQEAIDKVFSCRPDILAHNLETVPRLYRQVRPQADYQRSLALLKRAKAEGLLSKTGLMLGLGERLPELEAVFADLVEIRCDLLSLGQYLQPSARHLPVARFISPEVFEQLKKRGEAMGLPHIEAGPRVRSSYRAAASADRAVQLKQA